MTAESVALTMIVTFGIPAAIAIGLFISKNRLNGHQDKMAEEYQKKGEESCRGGDS